MVTRLDLQADAELLRGLFAEFGVVIRFSKVTSREKTEDGKSYALLYVDYESPESASAAVEKGVVFRGKPLDAKLKESRKWVRPGGDMSRGGGGGRDGYRDRDGRGDRRGPRRGY